MGNAAAKQLEETVLGDGTLDEKKSIVASFVTKDGTATIKSKGKGWVKYNDEETTPLWSYKHVGMFKKYTVVMDSTEKPVAIIVTVKKTMSSCVNFILKPVPSYDGQEALTAEELEKVGVKDTGGESLYKFAKIDCSKTMSTAKCTYGLVTAGDSIESLYEGERLSAMNFRAVFKETSGVAVAKASMPGMSMNPHLEVASGVDMLAVVSMGYSLAGDESSAGALVGAGVI